MQRILLRWAAMAWAAYCGLYLIAAAVFTPRALGVPSDLVALPGLIGVFLAIWVWNEIACRCLKMVDESYPPE